MIKSINYYLMGLMILIVSLYTQITYAFFASTNEKSLQPLNIHGIVFSTNKPVLPFKMTTNTGTNFTEKDLLGHWNFLFFGFTNCGFVCPTTLSALNKMMLTLEKKLPPEKLPQIIFISVDPKRDSVSRINEYLHSFNEKFIGLRAPLNITQSVETQFHIAAVKLINKEHPDQYNVNHSADIIVINPKGELAAILSFPHQPDEMVNDYIKIIQ